MPDDLPERELTRGWLKASLRVLDPDRSLRWKPWHRLTREARSPVKPGEIVEYAVEILATANPFKAGHRICVEITSLDLPTGVSTNVEYIPYHIASHRTTLHKIYHDAPSIASPAPHDSLRSRVSLAERQRWFSR